MSWFEKGRHVVRQGADDRVSISVRALIVIVAAILTVAGLVLTLGPDATEALWAWPMGPELTSLAVGGGYVAGAVLFIRAAFESRWHRVALVFPVATVLTVGLLIATVLHWEAFSHGHVSFWAWFVVYLLTPMLLPAVWLTQRTHDPGEAPPGTPTVPRSVRHLLGALGAIQLTVAVIFFVLPHLAIATWPWTLSPLTARTLASFLGFVGAMWFAFLFEGRWSALQLHVEGATLGLVLVGVGAIRASDDLTGGPAATTAFVVSLGGFILALIVLQVAMHRRADVAAAAAAPRIQG